MDRPVADSCECGGGLVPGCRRRGFSDLQLLEDLAPETLGRLSPDLPTLCDHLQLLDGVTAITSGHGAALAVTGRYASPTSVGGAIALPGVALRYLPGAISTALRVAPRTSVHLERPSCATIDLFDHAGRRVHQTRLASPADLARLDSVGPPCPDQELDPAASAGASEPVRARPGLDDQIDLMDSHLTDSGGARLRTLMGHDGDHARPVGIWLLSEVLAGVAELGLRPTFTVTSGIQQSHTGPVEAIAHAGRTLRVRSGHGVLAISTVSIHRMWISQVHGPHGLTPALELFDADGNALVSITLTGGHPGAAYRAWDELLTLAE